MARATRPGPSGWAATQASKSSAIHSAMRPSSPVISASFEAKW